MKSELNNIYHGVRRVALLLLCLSVILAGLIWGDPAMPDVKAAGNLIYVDADAVGLNDGSSWADAYPDLHSAIEAAEAGDQIWIAAGLYVPTGHGAGREVHFRLKNGVALYGGFAGEEDPATFDLNSRDFAGNETILSGDVNGDGTNRAYHVFYHPDGTNLDATAVLDGVSIVGGRADGLGYHLFGAGMHNRDSSPTLSNVNFRVNIAIHADHTVYGGGMYNDASSPVLYNVTFMDNTAQYGGGMMNRYGSQPVMTNVRFLGNTATFGGAMYNHSSDVTMTNALIAGNVAVQRGGGIQNYNSDPVLTNVTISGNSNNGMANTGGSYPILRNSIVWGNEGPDLNDLNGGPFGTNSTTVEHSIVAGHADPAQGNLDMDPLFLDPVSHASAPTTTGDYRLHAESPAINVGDSGRYQAGQELEHITTDLDGQARWISTSVDMGGYETEDISQVSVTIQPAGAGSVDGDGVFSTLDMAALQAEAAHAGYVFVNWTVEGNEVSTDADYGFTVTEDTVLVANFATVYADIEITASPAAGGAVSGGGEHQLTSEATVTVDVYDGFDFVNWTEAGIEVSTDESYSFTVTEDRELVANLSDPIAPVIELVQAPIHWTNGNVTITVDATDQGSGIEELKWDAGEWDLAHFDMDGHVMGAAEFQVSENGIYTVYAEDSFGNAAIETITISTINTIQPILTLTPSTTALTHGDVDISVTASVYASGSGNDLEELGWLPGSRDVSDFNGGVEGEALDPEAVSPIFTVSENGSYTIYAKDTAGNEAVSVVTITNIIKTAPSLMLSSEPNTLTYAPVTVNVVATVHGADLGNTVAALAWLPGNHGTGDFAGGTNGTDMTGESTFAVSANGTYTVYVMDSVGNETVAEIQVTNIRTVPPADNDEDSPPETVVESPIIVSTEDGVMLMVDDTMITEVTRENGATMEIIEMDADALEQVLDAFVDSGKPTLTIRMEDQEDGVQLSLPATFIRDMHRSMEQAVIDLELHGAGYQLAVQVLDLELLAEAMGVALEDLKLHLIVEQASGEVVEDIKQLATASGAILKSDVIDYKIMVETDGQSREISEFGGTYMPRSIVPQEGGKNQTGVMYDPHTHSFSYVPSIANTRSDGTAEMMLYAPHNSLYLIVEKEGMTFADSQGHWAQDSIERLTSKFIIQGVGDSRFEPAAEITRAEFTTFIVRSLGLSMAQDNAIEFKDVPEGSWYGPAVAAAVRAGLIYGYEDGTFRPDQPIRREELAVLIGRALAFAQPPTSAQGDDSDAEGALYSFMDRADIALWATQDIETLVQLGVIHGRSEDRFAPKEHASRAEAVVLLGRLLIQLGFM